MSLGDRIIYRQLLRRHMHIRIPMIQRDYAQGRPAESEVREEFLNALEEALRVAQERLDELPVRGSIHAQLVTGLVERRPEHDRRLVVERVSHRGRRDDPTKPMGFERQRAKKRGQNPHGVHGRANVVLEARERQLCRACPSSELVTRFQHQHRRSRLRQGDRGRQPVGARTQHDGVEGFAMLRHVLKTRWSPRTA